jgi:hypothetical protein
MPPPATERRTAPRYPADTRIFASIDERTVRILNISGHGVSILGHGLLPGSTHLLEINLDHRHMTIAIEILDCSEPQRLHARFIEPDSQLQRAIDRYVDGLDGRTVTQPRTRP